VDWSRVSSTWPDWAMAVRAQVRADTRLVIERKRNAPFMESPLMMGDASRVIFCHPFGGYLLTDVSKPVGRGLGEWALSLPIKRTKMM
jgi:hypothetical protein